MWIYLALGVRKAPPKREFQRKMVVVPIKTTYMFFNAEPQLYARHLLEEWSQPCESVFLCRWLCC